LTERRADRLAGLSGLLGSLGYRAVLARGYALVRDADGRAIRAAAQATPHMTLEFTDGFVEVTPRDAAADPTGAAANPQKAARKRTAPKKTAPAPAERTAQPPEGPTPPARQGSLFDL
jgi:exodeoxyribonuclease VII large subunit